LSSSSSSLFSDLTSSIWSLEEILDFLNLGFSLRIALSPSGAGGLSSYPTTLLISSNDKLAVILPDS